MRRSGDLRHTWRSAESCCRQALTRFTVPRCAGPDRRTRLQASTNTIACPTASRRGARAAESARLEIVCPSRDRGFKSHPLRQVVLRPARPERGIRRGGSFSAWPATQPDSAKSAGSGSSVGALQVVSYALPPAVRDDSSHELGELHRRAHPLPLCRRPWSRRTGRDGLTAAGTCPRRPAPFGPPVSVTDSKESTSL